MFLAIDVVDRSYVFCEQDPRCQGFDGPVVEDVDIDVTTMPQAWTARQVSRDAFLGRSPTSQRQYRVFRSERDCNIAGFEPLGERFRITDAWGGPQK